MNLDVKNEMVEIAKNAIESGDVEAFVNQMFSVTENIKEEVMKDYEELKNVEDKKILQSRGYFELTSNEKNFYDTLVKMGKNTTSLSDVDVTIPEETFDRVFEDLTTNHPLLSHINFINTKAIEGKVVMNTGISGAAAWGELCATISEEITSGFAAKVIDQNKLSAYMEVCKTLLDLGYTWLDRYVRLCLGEAIALALEDAILNGTGSSMPIGMKKTIAAAGQDQTIPAVDKSAVALYDLGAGSLGKVAEFLSNGGKRLVNQMVMVVNAADYYKKIIPAIRIMAADGRWTEYLPYPVTVVPSAKMAQNKAIFFIDKKYNAFIGLGKEGRIERSDEFKFYADLACYKVKLVAGGQPLTNNDAFYADITSLKPFAFNVETREASL